jgi:FKBP-type peptidyl-prolyl cis-trans isomerase FkpA
MKYFCAISLVLIFCIGCSKDAVCDFDECAVKATAQESQVIENYLTANNITAVKHCSGMYYVVDTLGAGKSPNSCANVTASYIGKIMNGATIDSGTHAFSLQGVIRGWTIGIPQIKEGGRIRLFIPPSLGYGPDPYQTIPGGSYLYFDIRLDAVGQ